MYTKGSQFQHAGQADGAQCDAGQVERLSGFMMKNELCNIKHHVILPKFSNPVLKWNMWKRIWSPYKSREAPIKEHRGRK